MTATSKSVGQPREVVYDTLFLRAYFKHCDTLHISKHICCVLEILPKEASALKERYALQPQQPDVALPIWSIFNRILLPTGKALRQIGPNPQVSLDPEKATLMIYHEKGVSFLAGMPKILTLSLRELFASMVENDQDQFCLQRGQTLLVTDFGEERLKQLDKTGKQDLFCKFLAEILPKNYGCQYEEMTMHSYRKDKLAYLQITTKRKEGSNFTLLPPSEEGKEEGKRPGTQ